VKPLAARISAGETLLADGALGSLLMERGLAPGAPPETFCLERPEVLADIVRQYNAAGAEVFQANTFGASSLKLARHNLADRAGEINCRAIEIVREAVGSDGYVWASVGPTGRLLRPYGDTESTEVYSSFLEQARALVSAGPDIIAVETMTDLAEACLAVKAVREASTDIFLVATMTFESRKRGFFTVMGNTVSQCASELLAAGADLVGTNCGNGIEKMVAIAGELRAATDLPLVVRPNAGLPELRDGKTFYPETPDFMTLRLSDLLDLGLAIIGGCCGTTPAHTRAFRTALDRHDRA